MREHLKQPYRELGTDQIKALEASIDAMRSRLSRPGLNPEQVRLIKQEITFLEAKLLSSR